MNELSDETINSINVRILIMKSNLPVIKKSSCYIFQKLFKGENHIVSKKNV